MARYNYHDGREVPQYYYYPWWSDLAPVTFLDPRSPEVYWRDDRYFDDGYRFLYRLQENAGDHSRPEVYWRDDRSMDNGYRFLYRLQDNAGDHRRPEVYWRDDRSMDNGYRFLHRLQDNAGDHRRPEVYWRDDRYMDDGYRFHHRLQDSAWEHNRPEFYWRNDRSLDDEYRFHYRQQDNTGDHSRHGHMPQEQVVRRDGAAPWWLDREYPYNGGYVGMYHLPPWEYETREEDSKTEVEMYVPLCCDKCERKVLKHLKNIEGVESAVADQWEKKVVVVGRNLRPDVLLRRMQRDKPGSVFWSDRPR